jgi:cytochrome c oxidase cbb3-type subunit 1
MAVNPKRLRPYDEPPRRRRQLVPDAPDTAAKGYLTLSLIWLVAATGIGVLWAGQLLFPDQLTFKFDLGGLPIIGTLPVEASPTTVASGFRDAVVFGWLSNAAIGAIFFITPRLLGVRLVDERMAALSLGAWNVGVAAGLAAVYLPSVSQTGPLAEFPLPVDGLLLLALLLVNGSFWRTVAAVRTGLPYISIWYFGIGLLALLGSYALGAGAQAPLIGLDQTALALINAFVSRAVEVYWLLGVALGALYYVMPRATGNPLHSTGIAFLGWVLWAGFAGLSALGALVDPSVPFVITSLGRMGTILMVAPIFLAVANLALTIRGRWTMALSAGTLAYAVVALTFLLTSALLEAIGSLRSVDGLVGRTEWTTGVWTLAVLGAYTFAFYALAEHAGPRVFRRDWRGSFLGDAQLWATLAGAGFAGLGLIATGVARGSLLMEGTPPEEIDAGLLFFRTIAAGGLGLLALGAVAALISLFLLYTSAPRAEYVVGTAPGSASAAAGH